MKLRLRELRNIVRSVLVEQLSVSSQEQSKNNGATPSEEEYINDFVDDVDAAEIESEPVVNTSDSEAPGVEKNDVFADRGADIHGFWYRSPGRPMGTMGDPFRPEDAAEYIGQKPKKSSETDVDTQTV